MPGKVSGGTDVYHRLLSTLSTHNNHFLISHLQCDFHHFHTNLLRPDFKRFLSFVSELPFGDIFHVLLYYAFPTREPLVDVQIAEVPKRSAHYGRNRENEWLGRKIYIQI